MILVTGATGHIGNVLVRKLLARGEKVRVIIPPNEDTKPIKGLKVEKVQGDLRDIDSTIKAFEGVKVVYHLAGMISILPKISNILYQVNVVGTRNVVEACFRTKVKRLVYTSSIHAFAEPPRGGKITEALPFDPSKVVGGYAKSKAIASLEVLKMVRQEGLDAVIVCPTGVIGPYDYKPSEMGQLFLDFLNGKVKAYIDGSYDFVDVRDVAMGHILACEKGKKGESYILSGEQITVKNIFLNLERVTGLRGPTMKIPIWLAQLTAAFTPFYYFITNTKPRFTKYSIYLLTSNFEMSCEKAKNELGYTSRPIRQTIEDTVNWLKENFKV